MENIHEYALDLSKEIERSPDIGEWLNEQLSLEIWKKEAPYSRPLERVASELAPSQKMLLFGQMVEKEYGGVESWKAEILITCGGPTVRLEIDSRWDRAELFHSWGWSGGWHCGYSSYQGELKECNISGAATEILKSYLEECC